MDELTQYAIEEMGQKKKRDNTKIWAKTMRREKITRDLLYSLPVPFSPDKLYMFLTDICHKMDIPTPMVLKSHQYNFENFNIAKFVKSDFVEPVDFDCLIIESAVVADKTTPKAHIPETDNYK